MPLTPNDVLHAFLNSMRDHNISESKTRDLDIENQTFAVMTRMQWLWYKFEYVNIWFGTKVLVTVVSTAVYIGMDAAYGATAGVAFGPIGMAGGAIGGAADAVMKRTIVGVVGNSVRKGRRQWELHQGRKIFVESWMSTAPVFRVQKVALDFPDYCLYMTRDDFQNFYYYWPGYALNRRKPKFADDDHQYNTFDILKRHIFFKPPKSGVRINMAPMIYPMIRAMPTPVYSGPLPQRSQFARNLFQVTEEFQKFDEVWNATRNWPMLDYAFFNQSFYLEFKRWAGLCQSENESRECVESFFYASRFYFLSKDFYLDHFFNHILPTYEIRINQNLGSMLSLQQTFMNVLNNLNEKLLDSNIKIESQSRFHSSSKETLFGKINQVAKWITDGIDFQMLSPDMHVNMSDMIRSLLMLPTVRLAHTSEQDISLQLQRRVNEVNRQLDENLYFLDATIGNERLDPARKDDTIRALLQRRRGIMNTFGGMRAGILKESPGISFSPISDELPTSFIIGDSAGIQSERLAGVPPAVPIVQNDINIGNAFLGSVENGLHFAAVRTGMDFASSAVFAGFGKILPALPKEYAQCLRHVSTAYNTLRFAAGSANMIYRAVTGSALLSLIPGDAVVMGIISPFVFVGDVVAVATTCALAAIQDRIYSHIDKQCLATVERLVVPIVETVRTRLDDTEDFPQHIRAGGEVMPGVSTGASATASSDKNPKTPDDFLIITQDRTSDAKIFAQSKELTKNKLIFGNKSDISFVFYGAGRLVGFDIVHYASRATAEFETCAASFKSNYEKMGEMWARYHMAMQFGSATSDEIKKITSGIFTIEQCAFMASAWARATKIAFLFSKFEFAYQCYNEAIRTTQGVDAMTQHLYKSALEFLHAMRDDMQQEREMTTPAHWQSDTATAREVISTTHSTIMDIFNTDQSQDRAVNLRTQLKGYTENPSHQMIRDIALEEAAERAKEFMLSGVSSDADGANVSVPATNLQISLDTAWNRIARKSQNAARTKSAFKNHIRTKISAMQRKFRRNPHVSLKSIPVEYLVGVTEVDELRAAYLIDNFAACLERRRDFIRMLFDPVRDFCHEILRRMGTDFAPYAARNRQEQMQVLIAQLTLLNERHEHERRDRARTQQPAYNDYSSLRLGLKFTKDPRTFTSAEQTVLYQEFGRVLRHRFMELESPTKTIVDLRNNLEKTAHELMSATNLREKDIKNFFQAYKDFIAGVQKLNQFCYYARIYQFLCETAKREFLESSRAMRESLAQKIAPACVQPDPDSDSILQDFHWQQRIAPPGRMIPRELGRRAVANEVALFLKMLHSFQSEFS